MTARPLGILLLALGMAGPAWAGSPFAGEPLYKLNCARCHGGAGMTAMAAMPDFAQPGPERHRFLSQPDPMILDRVERGRGGCPSFLGLLKRQQILDIIAYMRTLH